VIKGGLKMEDLNYFGVSTKILSKYLCFGDGFKTNGFICKVQNCKIRNNCKRAYEHCPPSKEEEE
jgi:hypothetical protein